MMPAGAGPATKSIRASGKRPGRISESGIADVGPLLPPGRSIDFRPDDRQLK